MEKSRYRGTKGTRSLQATGPPCLQCVFILKDSVQRSRRQFETVDTCLNPSHSREQDGSDSDGQTKVHHSKFSVSKNHVSQSE